MNRAEFLAAVEAIFLELSGAEGLQFVRQHFEKLELEAAVNDVPAQSAIDRDGSRRPARFYSH